MNPREVIRVAMKSIFSNKLRSMLTMLGVIIGVAAVIVMVSVSAGTEATIADSINSLGANLLFISNNFSASNMSAMGRGGLGGNFGLTLDDAEAIAEEVSGVVGVSVENSTTQSVKGNDTTLDDIVVLGTTPDFTSVREAPVGEGRFFTETETDKSAKVVVLGAGVAEELFGTTDPVGQKVLIDTVKFSVVGVMAEKGTVGNTDYDSRVYVPISVITKYFSDNPMERIFGNSVRTIYAQVEDKDMIDSVMPQIYILMAKRHDTTLDNPDISISTQQEIIDTQASTTESFRNLLGWVAGVSLLVGGIGIMNIMLVSVTERTREIGIRQSLGATPNDIRLQFLTEALILSLIGGLLGVLAGIGGAWIFGQTGDMRTVIVPSSLFLAFGSAAAIGIFFGFVPANTAARLDPIEALRHE
ncbi:MAG: ABC transporter permease [Chloroflexi bacterium]|nr:ABC transporter permease [Chloroflexota bacterium]